MKKFISSSVLALSIALSATPFKANAMQIVAIVVGGSVTTVALSGAAAVLGGAEFKSEAYYEALDVVATGDLSFVTPGVAQIINDLRAENPALNNVDALELLTAVVESALNQ